MIQHTIIKELIGGILMTVPVKATLQTREGTKIKLEDVSHVVVELQIERRHMHHSNCTLHAVRNMSQ